MRAVQKQRQGECNFRYAECEEGERIEGPDVVEARDNVIKIRQNNKKSVEDDRNGREIKKSFLAGALQGSVDAQAVSCDSQQRKEDIEDIAEGNSLSIKKCRQ